MLDPVIRGGDGLRRTAPADGVSQTSSIDRRPAGRRPGRPSMLRVCPQGAEALPPAPLAGVHPMSRATLFSFAFQPVLHRSCPRSQSAPWRRGHRGPRARGRRQVAVCRDCGSHQGHGRQALCEGGDHILSAAGNSAWCGVPLFCGWTGSVSSQELCLVPWVQRASGTG